MAQNGKESWSPVLTAQQITTGQWLRVCLFIKFQINVFIVLYIILPTICFTSGGANSTQKVQMNKITRKYTLDSASVYTRYSSITPGVCSTLI
jgi:hypothetical protein